MDAAADHTVRSGDRHPGSFSELAKVETHLFGPPSTLRAFILPKNKLLENKVDQSKNAGIAF